MGLCSGGRQLRARAVNDRCGRVLRAGGRVSQPAENRGPFALDAGHWPNASERRKLKAHVLEQNRVIWVGRPEGLTPRGSDRGRPAARPRDASPVVERTRDRSPSERSGTKTPTSPKEEDEQPNGEGLEDPETGFRPCWD